MEDLPEELNGGVFCPVIPFVLSALRDREDENHSELFSRLWPVQTTEINWVPIFFYNSILKQYLLEFFPVIVSVANDHGLQLVGLEELQDFSSAHFVEARVEALKQRSHWCVENVIHIRSDKFLPLEGKQKRKKK